jgi:hypothetical protein
MDLYNPYNRGKGHRFQDWFTAHKPRYLLVYFSFFWGRFLCYYPYNIFLARFFCVLVQLVHTSRTNHFAQFSRQHLEG